MGGGRRRTARARAVRAPGMASHRRSRAAAARLLTADADPAFAGSRHARAAAESPHGMRGVRDRAHLLRVLAESAALHVAAETPGGCGAAARGAVAHARL